MTRIFKICPTGLWREAERTGRFAGAPVDLQDGFIHLSTAGQVRETAAKHFAGQTGLVLVTFDADALGNALRWEPSRGGDLFPHLYRPLDVAEALEAQPLLVGRDGVHVFPPGFDGEEERPGPPFDPPAAGWARYTGSHFVTLVGPIWHRGEGEAVRYGLLVETRHLNGVGALHGGMVMALADQALGFAGWAANGSRPQATIQLDTHFVSGARLGDFVEVSCRVVRRTRSLLFMDAELTVSGRVVATAKGIWKMSEA